MIKLCTLTSVFLVGFSLPAFAQTDFQDRVRNLIDNMPSTSQVLSDDNHQDTLAPFYGQDAPEAELSHQNFDSEEVLRQSGDGMVARAYGNQKDSALSRPDMGLSVDDLSLADGAIDTSEDTLGGLFNGSVGSCEADFEGGYTVGEQFCRRNLSATTQACQQRRVASVDRDDRWECLVDTPTYKKVCGGEIAYSCTGSSGQSCLDNAITVSGGGVTMTGSGNTRYIHLPRENFTGDCRLLTKNFVLRVSPHVDLTSMRITGYNLPSALQIRVNGSAIHTSSVNYFDFETGTAFTPPQMVIHDVTAPLSYVGTTGFLTDIVNSGSEPIGYCIAYDLADYAMNNDVTSVVPAATRTAEIQSNGSLDVDLGSARNLNVSVTYGALPTFVVGTPRLKLTVSGSCCSQITGQVESQCN